MTKPESQQPQFKGLHTMIPLDVYEELTLFAKQRQTVNGSWDYGIVIRELLESFKAKQELIATLDSAIFQRLEQQELEFNELKSIVYKTLQNIKQEQEKPKEQLLGRRDKNGKDRKSNE